MNPSKLKTIALATLAIFLAASLMIFPQESLDASIRGLTMWWDVVFPSLLPFFIVSELLIGFGVVTFLGTILERFMRPLFKVPGEGGFVWAMGLASGYPAGAKLTARLRQEKKLTQIEAERLVTFTNSSNPLFIFGAIAVGFFHNPTLGIILALSHYLGNICVGICMRFHGYSKEKTMKKSTPPPFSFKKSLQALHEERIRDGRPLGKLLGDAVQSSVNTLLMIGGFIILFSVLNKLLSLIEVTHILSVVLSGILAIFHIPTELSVPLISGLFEITLGGQMASNVENATLFQKAVVMSFILAFSGFSVQAQVGSILAETDIRFKPYFIARILHGFLAAFFTVIFWNPLYVNQVTTEHPAAVPVFLQEQSYSWFVEGWSYLLQYGSAFTLVCLCLYVFIRMRRMSYQ
ncbi:sporulation integral membrane protein YlbJ [Alkalihalobacillus sp. LMS39]|uniref:sporulation integral membrane protein YlbJ n=1 Tax=Alkalihalobacillus sp. LMS39 TaxID=2924032 RepID=UPI001FB26DE0|nr:sporulation integral membrane protein YlbJ [Alkalihalobacillus sp. LMS39]UOE92948.1 sporulation integral membrane protein YlbJ [Alkalihalobacillus sp. LMS39]